MTIRKMTRSFRYAGLILPDPAHGPRRRKRPVLVCCQLSRNYNGRAHRTGSSGRHPRLHLHESDWHEGLIVRHHHGIERE